MTSEMRQLEPRTWVRSALQFIAGYRMVGVLLLLCAYYSFATLEEQHQEGEAAGKSLARQIASVAKPPVAVLVVARSTDLDARFADSLEAELRSRGFTVAGKVLGEPRDARMAMKELDQRGVKAAAIATTADCAAWRVFDDLPAKFPSFGAAQILYPKPYRWPSFLKPANLLNVVNQIVVFAVIAIGMTMVIITGGIDLSVGSLVAMCAVFTATFIRDRAGAQSAGTGALIVCALAGIAVCTLVGLFSGLMVTVMRLPPFIATLGVMLIASGGAYRQANDGSIYQVPDIVTWLGWGIGSLGIPRAVWLMIVLYLIAHLVMSRTTFGRYVYAVGGNTEAARLSGVPVKRILLLVYAISGASAGLGGIVLGSQLKSGAPTFGLMYELYVIAAVVVGGASLNGGEGTMFGTLIGALVIAVIQNGMNLTGVDPDTQKIVLGFVILGAVSLDMFKRRRN